MITITESYARRSLVALLKQVNDDHSAVTITSAAGNGVLISEQAYEAWKTNMYLFSKPYNASRIVEALERSEQKHDLDVLQDGAALSSRLNRAIGWYQNDVGAALKSLFAWTKDFTPEELDAYATEIEQLVDAATDPGGNERLLRAQREWQETAAAYAMGMRPVEPIEMPVVPMPVEAPSSPPQSIA
ncbi:type II toxin-antitoxin system Phd/YefM family antitoxin [Cryobacterium sp. 5B3]|uniref:type II toxin-antitoxin system Phd/YefM family antitoxin n=1 Tax=Cryobacterium sp. 5B3 TaxID=3048586 RepID=UPI002AB55F48|nr:type II toxin-antitoxin system Phd/YefM family antitoxin [Cryobacterium sp. 5B3]MDY7541822.1 type II toxin-antitoxin system Phd/YefM family antitoxin [Cryobacterium sp. 5B3]MEB0276355.1 type II toxin-antitoxin system Phd/YefM family antitoxin [Cryobacterium sp. 5B3]